GAFFWSERSTMVGEMRWLTAFLPPSSPLWFRFPRLALAPDRLQIASQHRWSAPFFGTPPTMRSAPCFGRNPIAESAKIQPLHLSGDSAAAPTDPTDSDLPPIGERASPPCAADFLPPPAAWGNREKPITFPHRQHRDGRRSGIEPFRICTRQSRHRSDQKLNKR